MRLERLRIPLITLAVAALLFLAGCGGSSAGKTGGSLDPEGDASGSAGTSGISSIEDLKAALEQDNGSAEWYSQITDITAQTRLGAPVVVVHVAWPTLTDDWDTRNATQQAIIDAIRNYDSPLAINIGFLTSDGGYSSGASGGADAAPMQEVFDLPPAPADAPGVKAWLDAVYGPDGLVKLGPDEKWYGSITSVEMKDIGSGPQLTIVTSLTAEDVLELDSLMKAVQTTGTPMLSSWAIEGANGYFSANGGGVSGPGAAGYMYPAR